MNKSENRFPIIEFLEEKHRILFEKFWFLRRKKGNNGISSFVFLH